MQQIRCTNCGRQWSTAIHSKRLFDAVARGRTHVSCRGLLQGFALIVIAVPMSRVELMVKIKVETIKAKLLSCMGGGHWPLLREILEEQFQIPRWYLSNFESVIVLGADMGQPDFLDWSKEMRRERGVERAARARSASKILGRYVRVGEIISKSRR